MNADERTPGQQGYGQQTSQEADGQRARDQQGNQQPTGQQQQQQPTDQGQGQDGGAMSTGQASYGNSGETDELSQNSSSLGQENDMGQDRGDQGGQRLFSGSDDDLGGAGSDGMPSALGGGGYGGSGQTTGGDDQDFASDGQGALDDNDGDGTTDIEIERSQGRESDVEGRGI